MIGISIYTFYFYFLLTNNLAVFTSFTLFATCRMAHIVEGRVEGNKRILQKELLEVNKRRKIMHSVKEEKRTGLKVCRLD